MKVAGSSSPMRLAACAVLGSLLVPGLLLLDSVIPRTNHLSLAARLWPNPRLMFLFYGPLLSAFTMLVFSQLRLQRGVKKDAWTKAELEPLRKRLEAPVWIWLYLVAFAVFIPLAAWRTDRANLFYLMIFPLQTVVGLRGVIKPKSENSDGLLNLIASSPIRSEDWGHKIRKVIAE